ncbi:hypothetical protein QUC32_29900 (plasmid) [Novosphingobium resinovorum]|nr:MULTISPECIES: hypothetical protein [Novosphingobium]MBF7015192.1 hypothetical protein [Novosphingobium sp. HR1a]WJM29872.1 hypothetical protein QUC32_29900 [Novosphingobium resinovorum]
MQLQVMVGGKTIAVDGVLFHSAAAIAKWQRLLAEAQPLVGSFSTGIGIWGSPGVALAGAAALGFLEAAVTGANQKRGFHILAEAYAAYERLKPRGVIVPVSDISNCEHPAVANWRARGAVPSEMDVRNMGRAELAGLKDRYGATDEELRSGFLIRETVQDLMVLPDEFVTCRSGGRLMMIKWDRVETYELQD